MEKPTQTDVLYDDQHLLDDEDQQALKLQKESALVDLAILMTVFEFFGQDLQRNIGIKSFQKYQHEFKTVINKLSTSQRKVYISTLRYTQSHQAQQVMVNSVKLKYIDYRAGIEDKLEQYFNSLGNRSKLLDKINRNWRDVSYVERFHNQGLQDINKLEDILRKTIINNQQPQAFKRELDKVVNSASVKTERILRTESTGIVTNTRIIDYQAQGIKQVMVLSALTKTSCEICRSYDHTIIDIDKVRLMDNAPPLHPNCKCNIVPYIGN
ncbi:minor capsid protein [Lactiplantibacillus plantarum]|uniref:minor capsid protein n=1 Tax=Lactiplantibacillus plantarum TaxID=1590 RepID=UPI0030972724